VGVRAKGSMRFVTAVTGALVAVGLLAASAPSQRPESSDALDAELQLVTAGPGTLTVSPAENAASADCKTDAQQYESSESDCVQHYEPGTRVTLSAVPDQGHSFAGWSDFGCAARSTTCMLTIRSGTRYVAARFSPVTLQLFVPGEHPFGLISVTPKPLNTCSLNDGDKCEFKSGTTVTLSREFAAPGFFWVGSCDGNKGGLLDAKTCRLRLGSNEAVGAGYAQAGEIPPPLGSGIVVVVGGSGRGKVTGAVINGTSTLDCGTRCSISGLVRYDQVRLTATASGGSHFYRWSNLSRLRTQVVPLSSTNRIQAVFLRN
jgi:Divergent InlB B-repeat domain